MPRPSRSRPERARRFADHGQRRGPLAVATLVVLLVLTAGAVPARAETGLADLLFDLRQEFEVLPLSDGYVLEPRAGDAPVRLYEVRDGVVIADGETVSEQRLERLLERDLAAALVELAALTAEPARLATARAGLTPPAGPSASEPAVVPAPSEPAPAGDEPGATVPPAAGEPSATPVAPPLVESSPIRRRGESIVSLGGDVRVEEDESAAEAVVLLGGLEMLGELRGDAVVIGGGAAIDGPVDGDVTVVGGSVSLGPKAAIDGDVTSVGGRVDEHAGARVRGSISEIGLGRLLPSDPLAWRGGPGWPELRGHSWSVFDRVGSTVALAVISLLILLVARRFTESVAERARSEPLRAGVIGLAAQVVIVPLLAFVGFVLLVSIIGIPLVVVLLPLLVLTFALALVVGYAAAALALGRVLAARFGWARGGGGRALLAGVIALQVWSIVAAVLGGSSGPLWLLALAFAILGFAVKYLAWTVGLGSVLLHKLSPVPASSVASLPPPPPPPDAARPTFEPVLFDDPHVEEDETYTVAGRETRDGSAPGDGDEPAKS